MPLAKTGVDKKTLTCVFVGEALSGRRCVIRERLKFRSEIYFCNSFLRGIKAVSESEECDSDQQQPYRFEGEMKL